MKILFLVLFLAVLSNLYGQQQRLQNSDPTKMQWFEDAKLGIFIHYGIYAVDGTGESWPVYNNEIPYDKYMSQLKGFTASKYDPAAWASLFKDAGAKYAVLTAKHHDGIALWDTKLSDLSVVKKSPTGRDLIVPYTQALRKEGLKVGIYYSHLDWSNPDYATVFDAKDPNPKNPNSWDYPESGIADTVKWNRFLAFNIGQLEELQQIADPDLWWFDGDWSRTPEQWRMKELRQTLL
jgi:alpha-L-fucosidase